MCVELANLSHTAVYIHVVCPSSAIEWAGSIHPTTPYTTSLTKSAFHSNHRLGLGRLPAGKHLARQVSKPPVGRVELCQVVSGQPLQQLHGVRLV